MAIILGTLSRDLQHVFAYEHQIGSTMTLASNYLPYILFLIFRSHTTTRLLRFFCHFEIIGVDRCMFKLDSIQRKCNVSFYNAIRSRAKLYSVS